MQIGALAALTGLSHDTLRFYEKAGLIEAHHFTRLPNGYKEYTDAAVARLGLVKMAKHPGFSLAEIRKLIVRWETGAIPTAEKIRLLDEKVGEIDALIAELERNKAGLKKSADMLRGL